MEELLYLSGKLNEQEALAFCEELQASRADVITLDISRLTFVQPFAMLLVASQVKHLWTSGREFQLWGYRDTIDAHSYLAHVGFFKFIGFDKGNRPGQARGSMKYLPITVLDYDELKWEEGIFDTPIQRAISSKADELAQVLTQSKNSTIYGPVSYCFRELIRNVFEHAATNECILAGQAYKDGRVGIAVVDYGRGLKASLEEKYVLANDEEAIKLAVRPGISRTRIDLDSEDFYANSGFGLYVLSELAANNGRFKIVSGSTGMGINENGWWTHSCTIVGTAVGLTFTKPYGKSMKDTLEAIIRRGEAIAQHEGRAAKASRSSRTSE